MLTWDRPQQIVGGLLGWTVIFLLGSTFRGCSETLLVIKWLPCKRWTLKRWSWSLYPKEEQHTPARSQRAEQRSDPEKSTKVAAEATGGDKVGKHATAWDWRMKIESINKHPGSKAMCNYDQISKATCQKKGRVSKQCRLQLCNHLDARDVSV